MTPQGSKSHDEPPPHDAQAGGGTAATWYSPAVGDLPRTWRQPPPLRQGSPSGAASGTNQMPGVVRPRGWGLIDTKWPHPRGRLGGGSAGLGGQALGAPRPGRFRPPRESRGRSGGSRPPPSAPPAATSITHPARFPGL